MSKILIIEDDSRISKPIVEDLVQQKFLVDVAENGLEGWQMASTNSYDLIVLDWMLPELDGLTICSRLRESGYNGSILMLTARDTKSDKIRSLDCGADDYVVKPFDLEEFSARVRAMVRRNAENRSAILTVGKLSLDPIACLVTFAGKKVALTPTEYRMLTLFLRNPNRVFTKDDLLERLWTTHDRDSTELVKAHIKGLRNNLRAAGVSATVVETIHGIGYRLNKTID